MKKQEIIYYKDELNDEFSKVQITPRKIDSRFKYNKSAIWEFCSFLCQNILSIPIKYLYLKIKFGHKFIGKKKIKEYRKKGIFIYSNHTQAFSDTFTPSMAVYPTRNFLLVNPANISAKGTGWLVEMLGAIPIPGDIRSSRNFIERIENRIKRGYSISIYPEAHIWPYYTKIRPFKSVSFKYPVELNSPVFSLTNTYQKDGKKIKMISYIDGPFFTDKTLNKKQAQEKIRNEVYLNMVKRSKLNNIKKIKYVKMEEDIKQNKQLSNV